MFTLALDMRRYMGSGGISYHMSCGCKKPLSEDTVACEWLQNSSAVVQAQAAAAFETGDIIHLAQLYSSQSEHSKAGRVYLVIINHCVISREQRVGSRLSKPCARAAGDGEAMHLLISQVFA